MSQGELPADSPILAELVEPPPVVEPRPWGFWMTLVFSLAVLVAFIMIQTAITIAFMVAKLPKTPITSEYVCDGLLLSVATWVAAPLCIALIVLLIKARRQLSIRDYLTLHRVSIGRFLVWAGLLLIFVVVTDGTTWLLGRNVVPTFMIESYRTAVVVPLLLGCSGSRLPYSRRRFSAVSCFAAFSDRGWETSAPS